MNTNTMNTAKDPRCPVCGNAVLGPAVHGNEGAYHPACAQAPLRFTPPAYIPVVVPQIEHPYRVTWDQTLSGPYVNSIDPPCGALFTVN